MVPIVPTLANVFGWQLHEEKPQKLHPPIFTNFIFSIREDIRFDGLKSVKLSANVCWGTQT